MTNDQILEMLKQVGIVGKNHTGTGDYMNQYVAFARLIEAATREEDARLGLDRLSDESKRKGTYKDATKKYRTGKLPRFMFD